MAHQQPLARLVRTVCQIDWRAPATLVDGALCPGREAQRSLVKLAQVVRDTAWTIMEALGGERSLASALRLIERRMRSGCHMNKRKKHPNSAQLLEQQAVEWALSWCE